MVTYIDAKNRDQYFQLFQKAKNILLEAEEQGISLEEILPQNVDGAEHFEIATLNQYFGYLDQLVKLAAELEDENLQSCLLRLPVDEDFFEIDANTRAIKIPTSFARNGIGVQGDETAEIVYFSIDRYFDHIDLANKDMNIVIQWEAKDKDKKVIKGISPSFGRDIATNPKKIIFGWPIYGDLTQSASPIKFAVRFYTLGQKDENNIAPITYSLSTLPAEVSIGATLNYDVATEEKIGPTAEQIRSRIQSGSIYDDSFPLPNIPIVSQLKAYDNGIEIDSRTVDLSSESGEVLLKVSALPSDFGAIQYIWHKQNYNPIDRTYDGLDHNTTNALTGAKEEYEEVITSEEESLTENIYYRLIREATNSKPARYEIINVNEVLKNGKDTPYNTNKGGYEVKEVYGLDTFYKIYQKVSTITVDNTGIYTVDVRARSGPNSVDYQMTSEEGIKIPGPSEPIITVPGDTEDNKVDMVNIIADENGKAVLSAEIELNDADKNSEKANLIYHWNQIINGVGQPITVDEIAEKPFEFYILTQNGHGILPSDPAFSENLEKAAYNQSADNVYLEQNGTNVYVYVKHELQKYLSTNPYQNDQEYAWLAFDIDTKQNDIKDITYGKDEARAFFTTEDVDEATSVGLDDGHFILWVKIDQLLGNYKTFTINDIDFNIYYIEGLPTTANYTVETIDNNDSTITNMIITGLNEESFDKKYYLDVTATRNKIDTTQSSVEYRITEAPKAPIIKRYDVINNSVQLRISDYTTDNIPITTHRYNQSGNSSTISIIVDEANIHSDNISYVWMKADVQGSDPSDWVEGADNIPAIKIDLQNDTPIDAPNTPSLIINDTMEAGKYYYCLVTNTLNNNTAWNASPYYYLAD